MNDINYRQQWADGEIEAGTLLDAIDELRTRLERVEKDAKRFRYIEDDADSGMSRIYGDDWVAVIDAAIVKGEEL